MADVIRNSLNDQKLVSISFFGRWIERPYEGWRIFSDVHIKNDTIILLFHDEEVLWVNSPEDCLVEEFSLRGLP